MANQPARSDLEREKIDRQREGEEANPQGCSRSALLFEPDSSFYEHLIFVFGQPFDQFLGFSGDF